MYANTLIYLITPHQVLASHWCFFRVLLVKIFDYFGSFLHIQTQDQL